jgi:hypothetical protein
MKYVLVYAFSLVLFNCNEKQRKIVTADDIIKKSIEISGGNKIGTSVIEFDFRDAHYKAGRDDRKYEFIRFSKDSVNSIVDVLNNSGFKRTINDSLVTVADSMATKYSASVNSVHYFSVLPYGLDGKAVHKRYLNEIEIKGKPYHKIEVTFSQDGGGEDFEDVFIYWIHTETNKVDYLAYSYMEDDGKGLRFREAYNERYISGIRFVDYNNYKPKEKDVNLEDLDQMFIENKLELLSKIELENVTVN